MKKKKQNEESIIIQGVRLRLLIISIMVSFYVLLIHSVIIFWEEGLWCLAVLVSIITLSITMLLIEKIIKDQE